MKTTVGTLLEAETLTSWVGQSSVTDAAGLYDWLRAGLLAEYQAYRAARTRGQDGKADADRALAEVISVTVLLDVISEELSYRRQLVYLPSGRRWPLARP